MSADTRLVPFVCTACHAHLRLPAQYLGKPILCPKCNHPQRFQDADQPLEPMDTTRALRADEIPERPVGGESAPNRPRRHFPTPNPADLAQPDPDFHPLTAPAARRVPDPALTAAARAHEAVASSEGLTITYPSPSAAARAAVVPPPVVMPRSRSLVVALLVLGGVCIGLCVAVVMLVKIVVTERERRQEAERQVAAAQEAAAEAEHRAATSQERLDLLLKQLRRP